MKKNTTQLFINHLGVLIKNYLSMICLKLIGRYSVVTAFDDVNDMVQTWNYLFLEIIYKHAPIEITK